MTVLMAYAWPMRPSSLRCIGAHHITVTEELHDGRLHRQPGDALCKPRAKFWGLDPHEGENRRREGQPFDCLACARLNERLHLVSEDEVVARPSSDPHRMQRKEVTR